jgi:glycopeptide antibiotics resistance protein
MREVIKLLAEVVNILHDKLIVLFNDNLGMNLTDKDLHFWIMGFIGMASFLFVYFITKWLSKLPFGNTMISFLYTMTIMVVLAFAIEIQQGITNRGKMEFADAIIGLWGYLALFLVYIGVIFLYLGSKYLYRKFYSAREDNKEESVTDVQDENTRMSRNAK